MINGNWEALGIVPVYMQDMFPKIAGTFNGLLIIVSSARGVWDDLEAAGMARNEGPHIMAVNDMIMHYPGKVHHAYSNDALWLPKWTAARRPSLQKQWEGIENTHTCNKTGNPIKSAKWTWPWPGHGTSGLNAVYTGLALGYDEIWLCGIPLDNSGHYFDPPWVKSNFENEVATKEGGLPKYWSSAQNVFQGRVKSFSGRTMALLGRPNR